MPLSDVESLAKQVQPLYPEMATPEDRLMAAYKAARAALIETLPKGTTVDPLAATIAQQTVEQQFDARVPALQSSFQNNTDLSADDAAKLTAEQSRQHYLYKYLIACDGLGLYASGYAKQLDANGEFPGDYNKSVEDRIRIFSEITHAHGTGALVGLVNNEAVVQQAAQRAAMSGLGGVGQGQVTTFIGSKGMTITLPSSSGAAGLGAPLPWQAWVLIGVGTIVAGVVIYLLGSKRIETTAETTRIICLKLIESGDKAAAKSCIDLQKEATNIGGVGDIIGKETMQTLTKYAFVGGLLILTVMFLPTIVGSVTQAQTTYQMHKAVRAAANRRRR
ncbi:MAG: hypothetical protein WC683_02455 [bacterium]